MAGIFGAYETQETAHWFSVICFFAILAGPVFILASLPIGTVLIGVRRVVKALFIISPFIVVRMFGQRLADVRLGSIHYGGEWWVTMFLIFAMGIIFPIFCVFIFPIANHKDYKWAIAFIVLFGLIGALASIAIAVGLLAMCICLRYCYNRRAIPLFRSYLISLGAFWTVVMAGSELQIVMLGRTNLESHFVEGTGDAYLVTRYYGPFMPTESRTIRDTGYSMVSAKYENLLYLNGTQMFLIMSPLWIVGIVFFVLGKGSRLKLETFIRKAQR